MHQVSKKDYYYIRMHGQQNIKTKYILSVLLSPSLCMETILSFYTTKQAKQKIVSIARTLEERTIKSHKTFLNAWQIPLLLSRTNRGTDTVSFLSLPFSEVSSLSSSRSLPP